MVGNMDILRVELCAELLKLVVLLLKLGYEVLDGLLQVVALDTALAQLAAQLFYERAVLFHRGGDELHVLHKLLSAVGTLTVLHQTHTVLSLIYFLESSLNLVECFHNVIYLIILLSNDFLQ